MKCPDCLGYGHFYRHDIVMDDNGENPVLGSVTKEPCRTCGGCGLTQCCEGEIGGGDGPEQIQGTSDYPEAGSR